MTFTIASLYKYNYGATVGVAIPDPLFDVEIQRSTDFVTFTTVAILRGYTFSNLQRNYFDPYPTTTALLMYRARLIRTGYQDGDWSSTITAYVRQEAQTGAVDTTPWITLDNPIIGGKNLGNIARSPSDPTIAVNIISKIGNNGNLSGSMQDGSGRTVTGMFHKPTDDFDDIDDTFSGYKKTTANEKTGANRGYQAINGAWELTTGVSGSAIIPGLGDISGPNVIQNGGGQEGALGALAPGWIQNYGQLVTTSAASKFGTRALYFNNTTALNSYAGQNISVSDGDIWEISGWIRCDGGSSGKYAVLNAENGAGATAVILQCDAPVKLGGGVNNGNGPCMGVALDGTFHDWTFVRCVLRFTATGNWPVFVQIGYSAATTGEAWFDGIAVREVDAGAYLALNALTSGSFLQSIVYQYDGVRYKRIAKGGQEDDTRHNAAVTFPVPFQSAPMLMFRGGATYQPASWWGNASTVDANQTGSSAPNTATVYDDVAALNPSSTGFTMRARLWQRSTPTLRNVDFGGSTATAVGQTDTSNALSNAPSTNDQYTIRWTVSVGALNTGTTSDFTATYTVAIESDATGTGTWVERATGTYYAICPVGGSTVTNTWSNESQTLSVSGVNSSGKFRMKVKSYQGSGRGSPTISLRGKVNSVDGAYGVSYNTSTGDQFTSKTPLSSDVIHWQAMEIE
jgi:hypothetical protein